MPKGKNRQGTCAGCGKRTSYKGRNCKSCFFTHIKFKQKTCDGCSFSFVPNSGVQTSCNKCGRFYRCTYCGIRKLKVKSSTQCFSCYVEYRAFLKLWLSYSCCCLNCGKILSSHKRLRCNSCQAKLRSIATPGNSWRRYKYKGIKYRSTWEVKFAKLCHKLKIKFEYERFCPETRNWPDFYIPSIDLYVEIHPDCWGPKNLPKNCTLLKTEKEIEPFINNLRTALYERDGK